jgi:fucose permease
LSTKQRVTLACFLAYFVMSGMLSPIGIVLPPLAERLGAGVADVAPLFSWLTMGILLGSALALLVFDWLSLRLWLFLVHAAIAVALLSLRLFESALLLRLALGVVGTGCGIGLAAAASTITRLYAEDRRASMLVITDSSFSVAGIAISSLAVSLVAAQLHWSSTYIVVGIVAAALALLVATTEFPEPVPPSPADAGTGGVGREFWPPAVWLCVAALFLYTLGQYSLLWWLPGHLESELGAPRAESGRVVARFWTGMLIAQLFVAWWVLRIGARTLVLLSVTGAFAGSLPLWMSESRSLMPLLALLWGLANLGLLKVVMAFATFAVHRPDPRLVAALLFGATSGTAVSPVVTGRIVAARDTLTVLQFGSLCYLLLALLIMLAWWLLRAGCRAGHAQGTQPKGSGQGKVSAK